MPGRAKGRKRRIGESSFIQGEKRESLGRSHENPKGRRRKGDEAGGERPRWEGEGRQRRKKVINRSARRRMGGRGPRYGLKKARKKSKKEEGSSHVLLPPPGSGEDMRNKGGWVTSKERGFLRSTELQKDVKMEDVKKRNTPYPF